MTGNAKCSRLTLPSRIADEMQSCTLFGKCTFPTLPKVHDRIIIWPMVSCKADTESDKHATKGIEVFTGFFQTHFSLCSRMPRLGVARLSAGSDKHTAIGLTLFSGAYLMH